MKLKIKLNTGQKVYFISDPHYNHQNICRGVSRWRDKNGNVPTNITRDFKNLDDMNKYIVSSINNTVRKNDILFCLGDWSFGGKENIWKFRNQINCKNVYLCLGNHDEHIENSKTLPNCHYIIGNNNKEQIIDGPNPKTYNDKIDELFNVFAKEIFTKVAERYDLEIQIPKPGNERNERYKFHLDHYPVCSWRDMSDGVIHLFGHVHLPPNLILREGKAMDVGFEGNKGIPYEMLDIINIMSSQPISQITIPNDHHADDVIEI